MKGEMQKPPVPIEENLKRFAKKFDMEFIIDDTE